MSTFGEAIAELEGCRHEIALLDELSHHLDRVKKGEILVPVTVHQMADVDYIAPIREHLLERRAVVVERAEQLKSLEVDIVGNTASTAD